MPRFWTTVYNVVGKDGNPVDLRYVDRSIPLMVRDAVIEETNRETKCIITLEYQGIQTLEDLDRGMRA